MNDLFGPTLLDLCAPKGNVLFCTVSELFNVNLFNFDTVAETGKKRQT